MNQDTNDDHNKRMLDTKDLSEEAMQERWASLLPLALHAQINEFGSKTMHSFTIDQIGKFMPYWLKEKGRMTAALKVWFRNHTSMDLAEIAVIYGSK